MIEVNPKQENKLKETILRLLGRLPVYLGNNWNEFGPDKGYFGGGTSSENDIRTNTSAAFALAVLLKNYQICKIEEHQRATLHERLEKLTRYLVTSHKTGAGTCKDGSQWGLNWQSSWWAAKLSLGIDISGAGLDPSIRVAAKRIAEEEADRHLHRDIPTGLSEDTKAEETAWDAEIIATAMAINPNSEKMKSWANRLVEFSANTFSRPSDTHNHKIIDGAEISKIIKSCNIHEDGSLENHGSAHFCYVASPLLSKAFCAYALARKKISAPDALSHNVEYVWDFAEPTFIENRFAYLGGQDWARYTYGEYFIIPALVYLSHLGIGTRNKTILERRIALLSFEAALNDDGSFFGSRFTTGKYNGQMAKYETDCFACLALTLELLECFSIDCQEERIPTSTRRVSYESLTCYAKQHGVFFGFSWRTLDLHVPNITFVPATDDTLAEWSPGNFIGSILVPKIKTTWVGVKSMLLTPDGVRITGVHSLRAPGGQEIIEHNLFAQLSQSSLTVSSVYVATRHIPIAHISTINWNVPNDFFNGLSRRYYGEASNGEVRLTCSNAEKSIRSEGRGFLKKIKSKMKIPDSTINFKDSGWLNIDDKVGIYHRKSVGFSVSKSSLRTSPWNSLNIEHINSCSPRWVFNTAPGEILSRTYFTVHLGNHQLTQALFQAQHQTDLITPGTPG